MDSVEMKFRSWSAFHCFWKVVWACVVDVSFNGNPVSEQVFRVCPLYFVLCALCFVRIARNLLRRTGSVNILKVQIQSTKHKV